MEFCLSIEIQEGMSYTDTLAMAMAGEAAGFQAALLAEHYYPSSGRMELMSADAWVYLGGLARDTERIRLGTLVSPVTFRHPAILAKMAATLDHISGGRAELGLGAGWLAEEHRAYGFPFESGPERVDILEEQLQVVTGLWSQDSFSHEGKLYRLDDCRFLPRPIQSPRLPILIGGSSTATRLPRLATRYADEYVVTQGTAESCREVRARLDRECERIGRDPAGLSLALFAGVCVGATEEDVSRYREELLKGARPHMRDTSTWILGTPEEAAGRLRALSDAGVDRLMYSVDRDLHREMVALLGERVAPLIN